MNNTKTINTCGSCNLPHFPHANTGPAQDKHFTILVLICGSQCKWQCKVSNNVSEVLWIAF